MKLLVYLMILLFPTSSDIADTSNTGQVELCKALLSTETGDQTNVLVSGVFTVGSRFYDPENPTCDMLDLVGPCIKFTKGVDTSELYDVRNEHLRVNATFRGVLYGPEFAPQTEDISVPVMYIRGSALSKSYYCFPRRRTKLVVEEILSFSPIPKSEPWVDWPEEENFPISPIPQKFDLPVYPEYAQRINIQGKVILGVHVDNGQVGEVVVRFGDPLLVEDAVSNVKTWSFAPGVSVGFDVEYAFRLERRPLDGNRNSVHILQLPERVEVVGAMRIW